MTILLIIGMTMTLVGANYLFYRVGRHEGWMERHYDTKKVTFEAIEEKRCLNDKS